MKEETIITKGLVYQKATFEWSKSPLIQHPFDLIDYSLRQEEVSKWSHRNKFHNQFCTYRALKVFWMRHLVFLKKTKWKWKWKWKKTWLEIWNFFSHLLKQSWGLKRVVWTWTDFPEVSISSEEKSPKSRKLAFVILLSIKGRRGFWTKKKNYLSFKNIIKLFHVFSVNIMEWDLYFLRWLGVFLRIEKRKNK